MPRSRDISWNAPLTESSPWSANPWTRMCKDPTAIYARDMNIWHIFFDSGVSLKWHGDHTCWVIQDWAHNYESRGCWFCGRCKFCQYHQEGFTMRQSYDGNSHNPTPFSSKLIRCCDGPPEKSRKFCQSTLKYGGWGTCLECLRGYVTRLNKKLLRNFNWQNIQRPLR